MTRDVHNMPPALPSISNARSRIRSVVGGDSRFTAAAAHISPFAKRGRLRTPNHHWGASSESAPELKQGRCIVPTFITLMRSARTLLVGTYQTPFQFVAKQ